jgi:hypothetical protein
VGGDVYLRRFGRGPFALLGTSGSLWIVMMSCWSMSGIGNSWFECRIYLSKPYWIDEVGRSGSGVSRQLSRVPEGWLRVAVAQ